MHCRAQKRHRAQQRLRRCSAGEEQMAPVKRRTSRARLSALTVAVLLVVSARAANAALPHFRPPPTFYDTAYELQNEPINSNYRNMIGALQQLVQRTRPDIAAVVGVLVQYQSKPNAFLLRSAKRVFALLKGTSKYCLAPEFQRGPGETSKNLSVDFLCD